MTHCWREGGGGNRAQSNGSRQIQRTCRWKGEVKLCSFQSVNDVKIVYNAMCLCYYYVFCVSFVVIRELYVNVHVL
jgi:hypothetical protein